MATPPKTTEKSPEVARTCLLILGMHRSGTSGVTRLISMLGAALPQRLMGSGPGNETGHWEPARLVQYHEQLLSELGTSWHDWNRLDVKMLSAERRKQITADIQEIVDEDFGSARLFVLKDPRISRFAPFFIKVLADCGIGVSILVVNRNPLDVIDSLINRRQFWSNDQDRIDAALLWLSHLLAAEKVSREFPHAIVSYESVLADPAAALQQAVLELGIDTPISVAEAKADMTAFMDQSHRHHAHRPEDVLLDPQLAGWVADSYAALRDLETRRNMTGARETLDRVSNEFNSALPLLAASVAARRKAFADAQTAIQQAALIEAQSQQLSSEHTALTEELERTRSDFEAQLKVKDASLRSAVAGKQELRQSYAKSERALAEARSEAKDALERAESVEARFVQAKAEMEDLRREIAQVQEQLRASSAHAEHASRALAAAEARKIELQDTLEKLKADHAAELADILSASRDEHVASLAEKDAIAENSAKRLEALAAQLTATQSEAADLRREIAQTQDQLRVGNEHVEHVNRKLVEAEIRQVELQSERDAARELAQRSAEVAAANEERDESIALIAQGEAARALLEQQLNDKHMAWEAVSARAEASETLMASQTKELAHALQSNEAAATYIEVLHQNYHNSNSWKVTAPLRNIRRGVSKTTGLLKQVASILKLTGGPMAVMRKALRIYRREGSSGLRLRLALLNGRSFDASLLFNRQISEAIKNVQHSLGGNGSHDDQVSQNEIHHITSLRKLEILEQQVPVEARAEFWHREITGTRRSAADIEAHIGSRFSGAKKVIMAVSHDDYRAQIGGVQLCLQKEELLCSDANFVYFAIHPAQPLPVLSDELNLADFRYQVAINGEALGWMSAQDIDSYLAGASFEDGAAVIHSMLGSTPEIMESLIRHPIFRHRIWWLHDSFSICPNFALMRNEIEFCNAPPVESPACTMCVFGEARRSHLVRMKRLFHAGQFTMAAPSRFIEEFWSAKSDLPYEKIEVIPHLQLQADRSIPFPVAKKIKVAFMGHGAFHKGWPSFELLADVLGKDSRYQFMHFGYDSINNKNIEFRRVRNTAKDPQSMTNALLEADVDVVVLWSGCPETFSYTFHEALSADVLVVANSKSGNIAYEVNRQDCGIILENEAQLIQLFSSGQMDEIIQIKRKGTRAICKAIGSDFSLRLMQQ